MSLSYRLILTLSALFLFAACSQTPELPSIAVTPAGENLPTATIAVPTPMPGVITPIVLTPAATMPDATLPAIVPELFADAQGGVAQHFDVPVEQVYLITNESVEWPDSCLGVRQSGMQCQQVITPGYRLFFETPHGQVEVHTNRDGTIYHILAPTSGIRGVALVGPACPGPVTPDQDCPDQPYQGVLIITDKEGFPVGEISTSPDGSFEISLPPGKYTVALPMETPFPTGSPQEVVVEADQFVQIEMLLDSGIR